MIEEEDGITLIDFKTDTIEGKFPGGFEQAKPILEDRYKVHFRYMQKHWRKAYNIL